MKVFVAHPDRKLSDLRYEAVITCEQTREVIFRGLFKVPDRMVQTLKKQLTNLELSVYNKNHRPWRWESKNGESYILAISEYDITRSEYTVFNKTILPFDENAIDRLETNMSFIHFDSEFWTDPRDASHHFSSLPKAKWAKIVSITITEGNRDRYYTAEFTDGTKENFEYKKDLVNMCDRH